MQRLIDRDVPSYFKSLEHLLGYCARPPFALERLSVIRGEDGRISCVRYVLPRHKAANWVGPGRGRKTTRPGVSGVAEFSPCEFLDRRADLVPRPAGGWRGGRAKPRLWLRPPKAAGAMDGPAAVKQARGVRPESQAQVRPLIGTGREASTKPTVRRTRRDSAPTAEKLHSRGVAALPGAADCARERRTSLTNRSSARK